MLSEYSGRGYQKNPLTLNLYTYCANNPIKYYDPSFLLWDNGAIVVTFGPGSYTDKEDCYRS